MVLNGPVWSPLHMHSPRGLYSTVYLPSQSCTVVSTIFFFFRFARINKEHLVDHFASFTTQWQSVTINFQRIEDEMTISQIVGIGKVYGQNGDRVLQGQQKLLFLE